MRTGCILMLVFIPGLLFADSAAIERAQKLYRHTDYQAAIQVLSVEEDKSSATIELLGQCYFMSGDYKRATEYLEKAAAAEPSNSLYQTWLGRVYGRRAETRTR